MTKTCLAIAAALAVIWTSGSVAVCPPAVSARAAKPVLVRTDVPAAATAFLSAWPGELSVDGLMAGNTALLKLTVRAAASPDLAALLRLIRAAREEAWFSFDRVQIDLVAANGSRRHSVDLAADDFGRADARFPAAGVDRFPTGPFKIGDIEVVVRGYAVATRSGRRVLRLDLTFRNTHATNLASPYWQAVLSAEQGGETLPPEAVWLSDAYYAPLEPGGSSECSGAFTLSDDGPLTLRFSAFDGSGEATVVLDPAAARQP